MRYEVGIPYYFWCEVDADSPEEALQIAHDTEGKMGESEDSLAIVTELPETTICGACKEREAVAGVHCQACLDRETEDMTSDELF